LCPEDVIEVIKEIKSGGKFSKNKRKAIGKDVFDNVKDIADTFG
jgi:hypothetical protein